MVMAETNHRVRLFGFLSLCRNDDDVLVTMYTSYVNTVEVLTYHHDWNSTS